MCLSVASGSCKSDHGMGLIIDGYNLLNVTGIFGAGGGARSFERSRLALLDFLADRLEPEERAATTIVFDAQDAPPGLPRTCEHRGLVVRFAPRRDEADDLIEELILADTAPRKLTVVSSDHRVQRAARRRRARAVDSEVWFPELLQRRAADSSAHAEADLKPQAPLSPTEVAAWVKRFTEE